MAQKVRKVKYFYVKTPHRAGQGARALTELKDAGVNLRAFSGFPARRGRAQLDFVPNDPARFRAVARKAGWRVVGPKIAFLIDGTDRTGAMADIIGKLSAAKINVTAADAVCTGGGRFGAILWVKPRDVNRAAKLLRARA